MNTTGTLTGYLSRGIRYLRNNKRQTVALMVCLAVSSFLWLMIKLNKTYVHQVRFQVEITGTEPNVELVPLQKDTLTLELQALGYQLLFNELLVSRKLNIRLRNNLLTPLPHTTNVQFVASRSLLKSFTDHFPSSTQIIRIHPDTLFFRTDAIITRKVPVKPQIDLAFQNNHLLYDTVSLNPDSVLIRGKEHYVANIHHIATRDLALRNLDSSFSYQLNLINPRPGQLRISHREVNVSGVVTEYFDTTYLVPLQLADSLLLENGVDGNVVIRCMIPVAKRDYFNPQRITISLGPTTYQQDRFVGLPLVEAPPFVKHIRIVPEKLILNTQSQ